jgi:ATP-dependent Lhr-like helicase
VPALAPATGGGSQPTRATPITLATRADLPWLLVAARAEGRAAPLHPDVQAVLTQLEAAGALFFSQLISQTRLSELAVREALWDGVARGLFSADGFGALRNLLAPTLALTSVFPVVRRSSLRVGARGAPQGEGRWSLMRAELTTDDYDALCEAVAEQWVARWGVLCRELAQCERSILPWRDVVRALRRLEARGVLRGGQFVSGWSGEQYATPHAVEQLRAVRREPRRGVRVELSGADPLNLSGILFDGPRVPALRTQRVVFIDGAPKNVSSAPRTG